MELLGIVHRTYNCCAARVVGMRRICRELSIRTATNPNPSHDKSISEQLKYSSRLRQFSAALADYFVLGGNLPKDVSKAVEKILFAV